MHDSEALEHQIDNEFGDPAITALFRRYVAKGRPLELGRTRCAFIYPTFVVKFPITIEGIRDNDWEGSVSNADDDPEEIRLARTRLVLWGSFPIVLMERVEWASYREIEAKLGHVPDWVGSVDCGQVGFSRDGRLLAFDYGVC